MMMLRPGYSADHAHESTSSAAATERHHDGEWNVEAGKHAQAVVSSDDVMH
jgi:hypothetical protein